MPFLIEMLTRLERDDGSTEEKLKEEGRNFVNI